MIAKENDFSERFKQKLFSRIDDIKDRNQQIIESVKKKANNAGIELEVSNIADTAIEKLITDIVPQFQDAGLNFYSDSIVTKAISEQIINYILQGKDALIRYNTSLSPTKSEKQGKVAEEKKALKTSNAMSRFLANLRKAFAWTKKEKTTITPEALQDAKSHLDEYRNLNQQLSEYDVHDNIISALMQIICPDNNMMYVAFIVPPLVEADIAPVLTKLGMGDLIPQLKDELLDRYEEMGKDIIKKDSPQDRAIFIPDFEEKKEAVISGEQSQKSVLNTNNVPPLNVQSTISEDGVEPGDD